MRKSSVLQIVLIATVLIAIVTLTVARESQRRRMVPLHRTAPLGAELAHTVLPMSTPEFPPDQTGIRYGHNRMALGYEGQVYAVYELGVEDPRNPGHRTVAIASSGGTGDSVPQVHVLTPREGSSRGHPSIATTASESGPRIWVAFDNRSYGTGLIEGPSPTQLEPVITQGRKEGGYHYYHTPLVVGLRGQGVAFLELLTSAVGDPRLESVQVKHFVDRNDEAGRHVSYVRAFPGWRTFQPPDAVVAPDGQSVLVALKAEYEGTTVAAMDPNAPIGAAGLPMATPESGAVESELLVYSVPLDGSSVGEPSVLAPRERWTYHERPLIASTDNAVYAVVGTWRSKDVPDPLVVKAATPRELRSYILQVLKSTDNGKTWTPAAELMDPQPEVATAAPQIGAFGNTVVVAYAFESRYIPVEEIGVMKAVMSHDGGASWREPRSILPLVPGGRTADVPLDLIVTAESAYLLFRRTETQPPIGDSIQVPPPVISLAVAVWDTAPAD